MRTNFMPQRTGYSPPPFVRTNRPMVNGNYNLASTDLGVVLSRVNSTCFFPAYTSDQDSKEYAVTNESQGVVNVAPAQGEYILQLQQPVSSVVIPSGESRQFTRETSTGNHYLVIV